MGVYQVNGETTKDDKERISKQQADLFSVNSDEAEDGGIGCSGGTLHVVRVSIGTGILFMPYTLMHLGYIMGAVVFILAGIVYYYVARMVLHTETKMRQQVKVPHLSYVELASHVFQASPFPFNKCGNLVKYFICVFYSIPFANTVYLVVMGEALQVLVRSFEIDITLTFAVTVLIVPLTIFCLFQRILKMLVPYSSVTNVITAGLALAIIIVSIINKTQLRNSMMNNRTELLDMVANKTELAHFMANATKLVDSMIKKTELANLMDETKLADYLTTNASGKVVPMVDTAVLVNETDFLIKAFGDVTFIPKSLAMYIQVFSCTSLLFAIKNDLQKPQKLTKTFGILNVAAVLVMVVHYFFGLSLYIIYGNVTKSNVLQNMPDDNKPTLIIKALFCLTLFVSYILTFFARFNNVWTNTLKLNFKNEKYATVVEYTIRIGYNLFAYILAVTIPNFGLVSAFAGSLSFIVDVGLSSLLVVLYRVTYQKSSWWIIVKNVLIIGACLVLFGISMNKNVNDIIKLYSTPVPVK